VTERWKGYLGFWIAAAVLLFGLGVGTLAALHHGRRIALVLLGLAAISLVIAAGVRRAAPRPPRMHE